MTEYISNVTANGASPVQIMGGLDKPNHIYAAVVGHGCSKGTPTKRDPVS